MPEYYRINGQALTYAEYWRMSPGVFAFGIAALLKTLHIPLRFHFTIPRPDQLTFLDPSEVPPPVTKTWWTAFAACAERGLEVQLYYTLPVLESYRECYAASFLSADGLVAANLVTVVHPPARKTVFACLSQLQDGRYFITSDQPIQMQPHPDDEIQRFPGAPPNDILSRHLQALDSSYRVPVRIAKDNLAEVILHREQGHVDYHIGRGVYVPMSEEEIEAVLDAEGWRRRDEEVG